MLMIYFNERNVALKSGLNPQTIFLRNLFMVEAEIKQKVPHSFLDIIENVGGRAKNLSFSVFYKYHQK